MNDQTDTKKGVWVEINGNHAVRVVTFYDTYIFFSGSYFFFSSEIVFTSLFLISYTTVVFLVILFNSLCSLFFSDLSNRHPFPLRLDSLPAYVLPHISTFSLSQKAFRTKPSKEY